MPDFELNSLGFIKYLNKCYKIDRLAVFMDRNSVRVE